MFLASRNSTALLGLVPVVTGSRIFKMTAAKPEVLISQLLDKIATPFQRLNPIFGVQQLNCAILNNVRRNRKSVIKYVGRQTGSTYISASCQDSNSVSTANPPFSGSSNTMAPLWILSDVTGSRLLDPENEVLAVETELLSYLEAEI